MTADTKMRVPKIAELIAEQVRVEIASRRLREGDRLPSEPALMASFGVSRPSVREALRILESEGLISVRRGAAGGALVARPDHHQVAARMRYAIGLWDTGPEEAAALMEGAELAAVRLLAEQAGRTRVQPWPEVAVRDPRFHAELVGRSGATLAHTLVLALAGVIRPECTDSRAHSRVLRAIRRGDAHAAVEIWRSHRVQLARSAAADAAEGAATA